MLVKLTQTAAHPQFAGQAGHVVDAGTHGSEIVAAGAGHQATQAEIDKHTKEPKLKE